MDGSKPPCARRGSMSARAALFPPGVASVAGRRRCLCGCPVCRQSLSAWSSWSHQRDVCIAGQGSAGAQQRPGEPWAGGQAAKGCASWGACCLWETPGTGVTVQCGCTVSAVGRMGLGWKVRDGSCPALRQFVNSFLEAAGLVNHEVS